MAVAQRITETVDRTVRKCEAGRRTDGMGTRAEEEERNGGRKTIPVMYPRHARGNKIRFPSFPAPTLHRAFSSRLVSSRLIPSLLISSGGCALVDIHLERHFYRGNQPVLAEAAFGGNDSAFHPPVLLHPQSALLGCRFSTTERSRNAGGQCSRKADSGTAVWPGRCIDRLLRCTFLLFSPFPTTLPPHLPYLAYSLSF